MAPDCQGHLGPAQAPAQHPAFDSAGFRLRCGSGHQTSYETRGEQLAQPKAAGRESGATTRGSLANPCSPRGEGHALHETPLHSHDVSWNCSPDPLFPRNPREDRGPPNQRAGTEGPTWGTTGHSGRFWGTQPGGAGPGWRPLAESLVQEPCSQWMLCGELLLLRHSARTGQKTDFWGASRHMRTTLRTKQQPPTSTPMATGGCPAQALGVRPDPSSSPWTHYPPRSQALGLRRGPHLLSGAKGKHEDQGGGSALAGLGGGSGPLPRAALLSLDVLSGCPCLPELSFPKARGGRGRVPGKSKNRSGPWHSRLSL